MANWVINTLYVSGKTKNVETFIQDLKKHQEINMHKGFMLPCMQSKCIFDMMIVDSQPIQIWFETEWDKISCEDIVKIAETYKLELKYMYEECAEPLFGIQVVDKKTSKIFNLDSSDFDNFTESEKGNEQLYKGKPFESWTELCESILIEKYPQAKKYFY